MPMIRGLGIGGRKYSFILKLKAQNQEIKLAPRDVIYIRFPINLETVKNQPNNSFLTFSN